MSVVSNFQNFQYKLKIGFSIMNFYRTGRQSTGTNIRRNSFAYFRQVVKTVYKELEQQNYYYLSNSGLWLF